MLTFYNLLRFEYLSIIWDIPNNNLRFDYYHNDETGLSTSYSAFGSKQIKLFITFDIIHIKLHGFSIYSDANTNKIIWLWVFELSISVRYDW